MNQLKKQMYNTDVTRQQNPLRIFVDADACPVAIKEILFRSARRLEIALILVANQQIRVPASPWIHVIAVPHGANVADRRIIEMIQPGDIVVTGDVPLAAQVVEKSGIAIGNRGELYDDKSVQERLASRNLMEQFRSTGVDTSGPRPLASRDLRIFANVLDRTLTRMRKRKPT